MLRKITPQIVQRGTFIPAMVAAMAVIAFALPSEAKADGAVATLPAKPAPIAQNGLTLNNTLKVQAIPEPGSMALLAAGLSLCFWKARRRA